MVINCPGLGNECRDSVERRNISRAGNKASEDFKIVASIWEQEGSCVVGLKQTNKQQQQDESAPNEAAASLRNFEITAYITEHFDGLPASKAQLCRQAQVSASLARDGTFTDERPARYRLTA